MPCRLDDRAAAWFQLSMRAGGEDGLDERFGYVRRQRGALVFKRRSSKLDCRLVPRQVLPTIHAHVQMVIELDPGRRGQLAGQVVAHELRELAAGHDEVTSGEVLRSIGVI